MGPGIIVFLFSVIVVLLAIGIWNILCCYRSLLNNQSAIMATLAEFQTAIASIDAATQNISAYVQGSGMSAAEQNEVLTSLQTAVPAAPTEGA